MKRILFALVFFLAPTITLAQSLAGQYDVWGRNLDGDVYEGVADVRDDGEKVTIFWNTTIGKYAGEGMREGKTLLIDWGADYLIVYTIMNDGELHGTWADGYALDRLSPR